MAGASAEPASRPLQGLTRQPRRRGEQARLSYRLDPPPKESPLTGHTHHRGGDPRRTPGLRETTPPLGLRHLSDDLERSRGTTEGPTRHARAPARGGAAQQRYSPPHRGEGRSRSTRREGEARASAVSEDPRPPLTPPEAGDRRPKVRARGRNPAPAFLPPPTARGEKSGEGPRGQTEKSRHVPREHLSLVWHGLGPARESTTTPHRSDEPRWSRGEGTARTVTRGARFKPHRQPPPPTSPQARAAHDPRRFENA